MNSRALSRDILVPRLNRFVWQKGGCVDSACKEEFKKNRRSRWKPEAEQQYGPWNLVGAHITSSLWSLSLLASFCTSINVPAVLMLTVGFIKVCPLRRSYLIKNIFADVHVTHNKGCNPNAAYIHIFHKSLSCNAFCIEALQTGPHVSDGCKSNHFLESQQGLV